MSVLKKVITSAQTRSCFRAYLTQNVKFSSSCDEDKEVPSKYFKRLKANQKRFQVEDGVPVWLKLGARDKILYQATWALTGIMTVWTFYVFYKLMLR